MTAGVSTSPHATVPGITTMSDYSEENLRDRCVSGTNEDDNTSPGGGGLADEADKIKLLKRFLFLLALP